jgi:hypothetical protein
MMLIAWHTMMKTVRRSIGPEVFGDGPPKLPSTPSLAPRGQPVEAVNQAHWPSPRPNLSSWDSAPRPHGGASLGS